MVDVNQSWKLLTFDDIDLANYYFSNVVIREGAVLPFVTVVVINLFYL